MIRRVLRQARPLIECFRENDVLTYASAIAFQLLVALAPLIALTLLLVGRAGGAQLWFDHGLPVIQERVTPEVYLAVADAVERVLSERSLLWIVLGLGVTGWQVAGSIRAVMSALNRIYEARETRSFPHRFTLSLLLAWAVILLVLAAFGLVAFGGPLFLPAALALLWATVVLLLRLAPAARVEFRWLSVGSALVVVAWIGASLAYGFYVRNVADFESAFGFVTAGLLLTGYVYASCVVFLAGAQIDELLRQEVKEGTGSARSRRGSRRRRGQRQRRRSRASSARARGG